MQLNISSLLQKQDNTILKIVQQCDNYSLKVCLPQEKNNLTYNLGHKSRQWPKINTKRYKNTSVNRLIFKYNLSWYFMLDVLYLVWSFYSIVIFGWTLIFLSYTIRNLFLSNEKWRHLLLILFNTRRAISHIHYVALSRVIHTEGLNITDLCKGQIFKQKCNFYEQKATSPLLLLLYIKQIKLLLNHAF